MSDHLKNLVFVGLNSRIAALDRQTGELQWEWRATKPRSGGYVSLGLINHEQLIASVNGYTYCLDPRTGKELWYNDLPGFGMGVTSLCASGMQGTQILTQAAAQSAQQSSSAAAGAGG